MAVKEVVNCGGIAEKNPFVMQIYADVCNRPMKVSRSAQTCALGAAVFGRRGRRGLQDHRAGPAPNMTGVKPKVYRPNKAAAMVYGELYRDLPPLARRLRHDASADGLHRIMKDLIILRDRVRKS